MKSYYLLHNKYYVKDESDNNVYEISSKVISIGSKTFIKDLNGNVLSYIEQEILHLMSNYNIYINDEFVCKISKKFSLFSNDYILSNGYTVQGSLFNLDFSIYNENGERIGNISRKFFSIGDKYAIEINDTKHLILILSIIVAISNDVDRVQASSNNSN